MRRWFVVAPGIGRSTFSKLLNLCLGGELPNELRPTCHTWPRTCRRRWHRSKRASALVAEGPDPGPSHSARFPLRSLHAWRGDRIWDRGEQVFAGMPLRCVALGRRAAGLFTYAELSPNELESSKTAAYPYASGTARESAIPWEYHPTSRPLEAYGGQEVGWSPTEPACTLSVWESCRSSCVLEIACRWLCAGDDSILDSCSFGSA